MCWSGELQRSCLAALFCDSNHIYPVRTSKFVHKRLKHKTFFYTMGMCLAMAGMNNSNDEFSFRYTRFSITKVCFLSHHF